MTVLVLATDATSLIIVAQQKMRTSINVIHTKFHLKLEVLYLLPAKACEGRATYSSTVEETKKAEKNFKKHTDKSSHVISVLFLSQK